MSPSISPTRVSRIRALGGARGAALRFRTSRIEVVYSISCGDGSSVLDTVHKRKGMDAPGVALEPEPRLDTNDVRILSFFL